MSIDFKNISTEDAIKWNLARILEHVDSTIKLMVSIPKVDRYAPRITDLIRTKHIVEHVQRALDRLPPKSVSNHLSVSGILE